MIRRISYNQWSWCSSTEPGISWAEDNFFSDWDPQIADKAITTRDAVLKTWSTIGRWELILSLKVVIWEVNQHTIEANIIRTVHIFNIQYQMAKRRKISINKFSPTVSREVLGWNLLDTTLNSNSRLILILT